jgi:hypothetical protein
VVGPKPLPFIEDGERILETFTELIEERQVLQALNDLPFTYLKWGV